MGTLKLRGVKRFGLELARVVGAWRKMPGYSSMAGIVDSLAPADRRSEDDWDLDAAWARLDYSSKLWSALRVDRPRPEVSVAIHRAVTAVYGRLGKEPDRFEETLCCAWNRRDADPFTLRDVLSVVQKGDVVVSFNWDLLVETLLAKCRFPGSGTRIAQVPASADEGAIRFAKPHGSLSWRREVPMRSKDKEKSLRWRDHSGAPLLDPMKAEEVFKGGDHRIRHQPALLGAVPIKSELIKEVQAQYRCTFIYRAVMKHWRALCDAVWSCNEVYVVGYGFPEEDAYGGFLIREAARRRCDRIARVHLYEAENDRKRVTDRTAEIFGVSRSHIAWQGEVAGPKVLHCGTLA